MKDDKNEPILVLKKRRFSKFSAYRRSYNVNNRKYRQSKVIDSIKTLKIENWRRNILDRNSMK
jgi:hypothetical protein